MTSIVVDKVLLKDGSGKQFMEFSFQYELNGSLACEFDIGNFQENFIDNYSSGPVLVEFLDGESMINSFNFADEGCSSDDETLSLLLLSEILAFQILENLPY